MTPISASAAVATRGAAIEPMTAAAMRNQFTRVNLRSPERRSSPRFRLPRLRGRGDVEEPLTGELSRYHLTVSRKSLAKLEEAKDALSHSHPGATTEEILIACMDVMLAQKAKQKGLVERPLKTPRPCHTDRVPAHVRREVMKRSGGRCEWVFENGERCNSTDRVECDHIQPRALGGKATVENTRAACRGHNLLAARWVFGDALMDGFTRKRTGRPPQRETG